MTDEQRLQIEAEIAVLEGQREWCVEELRKLDAEFKAMLEEMISGEEEWWQR